MEVAAGRKFRALPHIDRDMHLCSARHSMTPFGMSRSHPYHLLDVFTTRRFGGNQLAVFDAAEHIPPARMQSIARELNLSETVFLLPPSSPRAAKRMRIFTPRAELPFAGHPTVGTACLLVLLQGLKAGDPAASVVLQQQVGDVTVIARIDAEHGLPYAQLSAARPLEVGEVALPSGALATLLSLDEAEVVTGEAGAAIASVGTPFLFVPLRNRAALTRCVLDLWQWSRDLATTAAPHVFVYVMPDARDAAIHARMFAPAMGIPEDPATGSAATALAGLLATRAGADGLHRWRVEQGHDLGRPSAMDIEAEREAGIVTAMRVGGYSVLMGQGSLVLDDE